MRMCLLNELPELQEARNGDPLFNLSNYRGNKRKG